MKRTEENKMQKTENKKIKNAETLAAVHTHTHRCFRE